jgi:hypothetical protein
LWVSYGPLACRQFRLGGPVYTCPFRPEGGFAPLAK